jgi:hypothetical protein
LLCCQSVRGLFSFFIFFEFYELNIAEGYSEDCTVPDGGVMNSGKLSKSLTRKSWLNSKRQRPRKSSYPKKRRMKLK